MIAALVAATLVGVTVGACVGAVAAQQATYQAVKWLTQHKMDKKEAPAPVNREAGASFALVRANGAQSVALPLQPERG